MSVGGGSSSFFIPRCQIKTAMALMESFFHPSNLIKCSESIKFFGFDAKHKKALFSTQEHFMSPYKAHFSPLEGSPGQHSRISDSSQILKIKSSVKRVSLSYDWILNPWLTGPKAITLLLNCHHHHHSTFFLITNYYNRYIASTIRKNSEMSEDLHPGAFERWKIS